MLDDDLQKKLREKQAKLIKQSKKSVSFSRVVNLTLSEGIKKSKKWCWPLVNVQSFFEFLLYSITKNSWKQNSQLPVFRAALKSNQEKKFQKTTKEIGFTNIVLKIQNFLKSRFLRVDYKWSVRSYTDGSGLDWNCNWSFNYYCFNCKIV